MAENLKFSRPLTNPAVTAIQKMPQKVLFNRVRLGINTDNVIKSIWPRSDSRAPVDFQVFSAETPQISYYSQKLRL